MEVLWKVEKETKNVIKYDRIAIGTVFSCDLGEAILKTYSGLVDLKAPNRTWDYEVEIVDYRPLKAAIVINGYL